MRAAIYNRVSTAEQDVEACFAELRQAALMRGHEVALEVREVASGVKADRPGLQRVLDAARCGDIQVVLVTALDRFGRSALDLHVHIRALIDAGCRFVALRQGLDLQPEGNAVGLLILNILAGVAEFERELIRERTKAGLVAARARGVRLGRPPRYTINSQEVAVLRREGLSWRQVAGQLGCSRSAARRAFAAL